MTARATPNAPAGRSIADLAVLGLAALTVGLQILWPLTRPPLRDAITVTTVLTFAAMSVLHAARTRGPRAALALLAVAGGVGLAAEAVGVATGLPFGDYAYADRLGPKLLGVPVIVPLAWVMMAWPALLVARALVGPRSAAVPLVAAGVLASWDLFLDPQMVDEGHWTWTPPFTALPGVPDIPAQNYLGWLIVALVIQVGLHATVPDRDPDPPRPWTRDRVPLAMYLWTWASGILANAAFWGRPSVALVGGVAMGLFAVPLTIRWRRATITGGRDTSPPTANSAASLRYLGPDEGAVSPRAPGRDDAGATSTRPHGPDDADPARLPAPHPGGTR
jgi:putative membrane protein